MPRFSDEDVWLMRGYVIGLHDWFRNWLLNPVKTAMGHMVPSQLTVIDKELLELMSLFNSHSVDFEDHYAPLLKLALLKQKQSVTEKQEELRARTNHPELLRMIDQQMESVTRLMSEEWLSNTETFKMPPLTEFLTLRSAYEFLRVSSDSFESRFDEKFGILHPHSEFLPRLKNCRLEGWLRDVNISVAFIDIDDFKRFNSNYGETIVDRDLLPRIMRTFEAHVFSHGWAYRFGGDEYVFLLPNLQLEYAERFSFDLQKKLLAIQIPGINDRITVSIGLCSVSSESFLTDTEILQRANKAKEYAKESGKKNCIAIYRGALFRDEDLAISTSKL